MTHTPGPWVALLEGDWGLWSIEHEHSDSDDVDWICDVHSSEANAALIAAAPDLLKACESIMECPYLFDEATIPKAGIAAAPNQVVVNMSVGWPRIQAIKNAVAKAKGHDK